MSDTGATDEPALEEQHDGIWGVGPVNTDLDGATQRQPLNAYPTNAGQFAALWNEKSETERDGWVRHMVAEAQEAERAERVGIDVCHRAIAAEQRVAELEAALKQAFEEAAEVIDRTSRNWGGIVAIALANAAVELRSRDVEEA